MSYIRLVDVKVSARLGYELTAASLAFGISPRTFITATVDILPQTSLDPDTVFALDQLLPFEIGKVTLDIAVAEDGIESIGIIKQLEDEASTNLDVEFSVGTGFTDTTTADAIWDRVFDAQRGVTSSVGVLDISAYSVGVVHQDAVGTGLTSTVLGVGKLESDIATTTVILDRVFDADRGLADNTTISLGLVADVAKVSTDTAITSDLGTYQIGKALSDQTYSSTATVFSVGAVLGSIVAGSDVVDRVLGANRAVSESVGSDATSTLAIGQVSSDVVVTNAVASRVFDAQRSGVDVTSTNTELSLGVSRGEADIVTNFDSIETLLSIVREFTESVGSDATSTLAIGQVSSDVVVTNAVASRVFDAQRSEADTTNISDVSARGVEKVVGERTDFYIDNDYRINGGLINSTPVGSAIGDNNVVLTDDSVQYLYNASRLFGDTPTASTLFDRTFDSIRSVVDSVGSTDGASLVFDAVRSESDIATTAVILDRVLSANRAVSESVAVATLITNIVATAAMDTTTTVVSSPSRVFSANRAVSEVLNTGFTVVKGASKSIPEAVSVVSSPSRVFSANRTVSESVGATDVVTFDFIPDETDYMVNGALINGVRINGT